MHFTTTLSEIISSQHGTENITDANNSLKCPDVRIPMLLYNNTARSIPCSLNSQGTHCERLKYFEGKFLGIVYTQTRPIA